MFTKLMLYECRLLNRLNCANAYDYACICSFEVKIKRQINKYHNLFVNVTHKEVTE